MARSGLQIHTAPKLACQTVPSLITVRLSSLPAYPLDGASLPSVLRALRRRRYLPIRFGGATARWSTAEARALVPRACSHRRLAGDWRGIRLSWILSLRSSVSASP
jgi:hypothetical protein